MTTVSTIVTADSKKDGGIGHVRLEWPVTIRWNERSRSFGIGGHVGVEYAKAMECLVKDKESLLAFYDFPAAHWQHIRTTNPIESVFATVRLRTMKTKNCGNRMTTFTKMPWTTSRGYFVISLDSQMSREKISPH